MKKPSEKFYGKQLVQEYEDLLNYCKADNRVTPINWGKVMKGPDYFEPNLKQFIE